MVINQHGRICARFLFQRFVIPQECGNSRERMRTLSLKSPSQCEGGDRWKRWGRRCASRHRPRWGDNYPPAVPPYPFLIRRGLSPPCGGVTVFWNTDPTIFDFWAVEWNKKVPFCPPLFYTFFNFFNFFRNATDSVACSHFLCSPIFARIAM